MHNKKISFCLKKSPHGTNGTQNIPKVHESLIERVYTSLQFSDISKNNL